MYYAATVQWMQEDPIQFQAGDANLRRYVENNPTNAIDPTGLDFKIAGNKMMLNVQLQVKWVDGKASKWTEKDQKDFMTEFEKQVEAIWNNNPFVLVSKDGEKKYIPQIEISFPGAFTNTDHKYTLRVTNDALEGKALAYVKDNTLNASASNALRPLVYEYIPTENGKKPIKIEGFVVAHEYGHLIGLNHPGAFVANPEELIPVYSTNTSGAEEVAEKGANSAAAYEADVISAMGRGNELRWWMFSGWADYLNKDMKDGAPWKVGADSKHAKYKSFYNNWETYAKKRLEGFPGVATSFPKLVTFEQK